jgi:hypothetical protein
MKQKNEGIWEALAKDFEEFPEGQCGSVDGKEIIEAEKFLNVYFSQGYKRFLRMYGGASVPGHYIYGLRRQINMGERSWSVIHRTDFYKNVQKWPDIEDWYIVSDDGSGNPIGIDPEGRVWLSDHNSGFEKVKLADSFEEFLYRLYTETLYEELPDEETEAPQM